MTIFKPSILAIWPKGGISKSVLEGQKVMQIQIIVNCYFSQMYQ